MSATTHTVPAGRLRYGVKPYRGLWGPPPTENGSSDRCVLSRRRSLFQVVVASPSTRHTEQGAGGRHGLLKIAQPFMAGFTVRKRPQSRQGRKKCSTVPDGTLKGWLTNYPAINGWAIITRSRRIVRRPLENSRAGICRNKKAAFVSEGRFTFAGIDFICPVSRAGSAAWAVCRCGRRRCPR
jgi:hypothetical protein